MVQWSRVISFFMGLQAQLRSAGLFLFCSDRRVILEPVCKLVVWICLPTGEPDCHAPVGLAMTRKERGCDGFLLLDLWAGVGYNGANDKSGYAAALDRLPREAL